MAAVRMGHRKRRRRGRHANDARHRARVSRAVRERPRHVTRSQDTESFMTLLSLGSKDEFPDAARRVFTALGVAEWEERDSDNFPGGDYFLGRAGARVVRVSRE